MSRPNSFKCLIRTVYWANKGLLSRNFSSQTSKDCNSKVGYILGVFESDGKNIFTKAAQSVDDKSSGNLKTFLNYGGLLKSGKSRVLYGVSPQYPVVSVVGLGKKIPDDKPYEECDQKKENVRKAVAAGVKSLSDSGVERLIVDDCSDSECAAEGALLANFKYQELKKEQKPLPNISCFSDQHEGWSKGAVLAESQNIARRLMETPANILTPTQFAQEAVTLLEHLGVEVCPRTAEWARARGMESFLSVAKGSAEPPIFLELNYKGSAESEPPLAIVGKGVTFDAGGISIKPSAKMDLMRADMGGAACSLAAIFAAATLKLKLNIRGFIPLCENLPSGTANKPGDVVRAGNGLTIQIDDTDAEGRLILADALHHASQFKPKAIVDMATLTGAMMSALGAGATGAFTHSRPLFNLMHKAGHYTGDRVWHMPMFDTYESEVKGYGMGDVHNLGKRPRYAGASLAAVFLKQFVTCDHWIHLDIAGVMENADQVPYLSAGMSGRPTRTIVKMAEMMANGDFKV